MGNDPAQSQSPYCRDPRDAGRERHAHHRYGQFSPHATYSGLGGSGRRRGRARRTPWWCAAERPAPAGTPLYASVEESAYAPGHYACRSIRGHPHDIGAGRRISPARAAVERCFARLGTDDCEPAGDAVRWRSAGGDDRLARVRLRALGAHGANGSPVGSAPSIRRASASIVSAKSVTASSAPSSPHPATYGIASPSMARPAPAQTT